MSIFANMHELQQLVGEMAADAVEKLDRETKEESLPTSTDSERKQESFEGGAVRDAVNYRYDLMSPHAVTILGRKSGMVDDQISILRQLLQSHQKPMDCDYLIECLCRICLCVPHELFALYAQALHEGAEKYGERNWEKGLPTSNLINHAIGHLLKLSEGDTSENHKSHFVWNVLTYIHFRLLEQTNAVPS